MSYEEFVAYYKRWGRCPNDVGFRKNPMNEKQLKTRYSSYLRSLEKAMNKPEKDDGYNEFRQAVRARDGNRCQFSSRLKSEGRGADLFRLESEAGPFLSTTDVAHIFGKGAFPHLKVDPDNGVVLNRYSHSMLDTYHDPITGKAISKEEHRDYWIFIVGRERYEYLLEKSVRGNA